MSTLKKSNPSGTNYLEFQPGNAPPELTATPRWALEVEGPCPFGGKPIKLLAHPDGHPASTTDPNTWSKFEATKIAHEAAVAQGHFNFKTGQGWQARQLVGIAFVPDSGVAGMTDPNTPSAFEAALDNAIEAAAKQAPTGGEVVPIRKPRPVTKQPAAMASVIPWIPKLRAGAVAASEPSAGSDINNSGADAAASAGAVAVATAATPQAMAGAVQKREPLCGGTFDKQAINNRFNQHYFMGSAGSALGIIHQIEKDGSVTRVQREHFNAFTENIFAKVPDGKNGTKRVPAGKLWRESEQRHDRRLVFKPTGNVEPGEYNQWHGFAVEPSSGRGKMRRLLRHIWKLICRRDKVKFKYLVKWLAFAVQHPDQAPDSVVVLVSEVEGTGKGTLGNTMCYILGKHGLIIADKERLLGKFNAHLETVVFLLADEIHFAGSAAERDKLKSMVTSPTLTIEDKFFKAFVVPNRLHVIMTTNHEHAVSMGSRNRRYVVLDVDDSRAQDKTYFDPLHADLENGGYGEFLDFLLKVNLKGWHPRLIIKTAEGAEQARMSGDSLTQWMRASLQAGEIVGAPHGVGLEFSKWQSTAMLQAAYAGYCRQHSQRTVTAVAFGKRLTKMSGARVREGSGRRQWGYLMPDEDTLQRKLDACI